MSIAGLPLAPRCFLPWLVFVLGLPVAVLTLRGQEPSAGPGADDLAGRFEQDVQPLMARYCARCHGEDEQMSGIRIDQLNGSVPDDRIDFWNHLRKQLVDESMPPEDEPQPTSEQRQRLVRWIEQATAAAQRRPRPKHGSVRRLTVDQYRNTLRELLGLEDDLTDILPPDAVSADGFVNNAQTMQLSPLLIEAYFEIAEQALDRCIVDPSTKPRIQAFRMDLGKAINPEPFPEKLILGANSLLLENQDFQVRQVQPEKPFAYDPIRMRTKFRFIEGYQGNSTVRGWREYDSIYHAVFACMRGNRGYPKGLAYQTVPRGLLLRPAIPSAELFQVESTYGPRANFKISLRQLPDVGRCRVTVRAARYDDGLLLDPQDPPQPDNAPLLLTSAQLTEEAESEVAVPEAGVYQVEVHLDAQAKANDFHLSLGARRFAGRVAPRTADGEAAATPFLLVRLPAGKLKVAARFGDNSQLHKLTFARVPDDSPAGRRFRVFEQRKPLLGVHLGLRRDCGSTLDPVGEAQIVASDELTEYVFEGAISDFPSPDVEKDNVNYLAGVREIGVRSEYTDGRDMPRLLIQSVQFEGPHYESWPPTTHRRIFIESQASPESEEYAREVIRHFATRAFRRPITAAEEAALMKVWKNSLDEGQNFRESVKNALVVVLTSPQFLFLIEDSAGPEGELLDPYELASKLSYFLWNTAPDERLLQLAAAGNLHESLDAEVERMTRDPRFEQFVQPFASQWLSLDKLDVVEVDRQRFPRLTRDTKRQLRREPEQFLLHLFREDLPARHLVESDLILANEVVANYYDLGDRVESGLRFEPLRHEDPHLGGVLTQAAILAGLSNGRESNPVKRGAWLARKLVAEPPDPPPPNVPALPEDEGEHLSLREKLELHRNQKGCVKCHEGIDPWGLPLEEFDAAGRFKSSGDVDATSVLPDGTRVVGTNALKAYLAEDRLDQVAFSVLKHLAIYATGRTLSYNEIETLREKALELREQDYRMQAMLRYVVNSEMFLEK